MNEKEAAKVISKCSCSSCGCKTFQFSYRKITKEWETVKNSQVVKNKEETYSECWGKQSFTQVDIFRMEEEAETYVEEMFRQLSVVPDGEKKELGTKKEWRDGVIKYLRRRPLIFSVSVLSEWNQKKSTKWAIEFVTLALSKLQDYFFEFYESNEVNEKEREVFKDKVFKNFSNSELAKKLKEEDNN